MKAYVIKNKEGKYWQWLFNDEPDWEEELYNAFLHYSKEDAKRNIIDWQLKDCEVVEITIAEGDLEQQLADKEVKIEVLERDADNLYRTLEEANEELADKDKEIERLKKIKVPEKVIAIQNDIEMTTDINGVKFNIDQLDIINNLRLIQTQPEIQKQIRHQVCDEIIKLAMSKYIEYGDYCVDVIMRSDLEYILYQIEKGENDAKN